MKHKQAGFTLIEILIALMIFAIMGVLGALSLHSIIRAHQQLKESDRQLLQLQVTMTLLRRDISEVIDRKIRDGSDVLQPAFLASGNGIVFTRTGLSDPSNTSRQSNMQRIGYVLQGDNLVRQTWDVLDQSPHSKSEAQIILRNVQSITWQFVADDGTKSSGWPSSTTSSEQSDLPKVVLMVMHLKKEGVVQGVFPVPARGAYVQAETQKATP